MGLGKVLEPGRKRSRQGEAAVGLPGTTFSMCLLPGAVQSLCLVTAAQLLGN